jgi:hypothetical protein
MPIPNGPFKEFPELRKLAADLMQHRRLPITTSKTLFAGYGDGSACRLCAQPITKTDIEYELTDDSFTRHGTRLHLWCHHAWQMELATFVGTPSTNPPQDRLASLSGALEH